MQKCEKGNFLNVFAGDFNGKKKRKGVQIKPVPCTAGIAVRHKRVCELVERVERVVPLTVKAGAKAASV